MQRLLEETDAVLAEQVLEAALRVTRMGRAELRRRAPEGVSASQVRTLSFLDRHPGASLAEVAESVGLGAPAASRLTEGLVHRGLVARDAAAADRRRVSLRLLPAGARVLAEAMAAARAPVAERLALLGAEEKARLSEALAWLMEVLGAAPAGGESGGG